jgi:hypothetical protein
MRDAFMLAIGLGALLIGAPARAKDNASCAQFEEPLAYNACLARHGPHAGATRAIAAPDEDFGAPGVEARRGGERHRLEFDIGEKRRRP